ncbi:MAG: hypothetical protein IJ766_01250 [Clostridia bacterium]|nr:hypothetical protein [Clostridia bacterium]
MGGFALFMKKNKLPRKSAFYPATASLQDEAGKPLVWEIRPLMTREAESIRLSCLCDNGKGGAALSGDFIPRLCAAAVVYPDLCDAALQDSYGVCTPHELLLELLDAPGEFNAFVSFVREQSGLDITVAQLAEEAKN